MKIGLTQRVLYHKGRAYDSIEHGWYQYLKDHTLYTIPNKTDQDFKSVANNLDILILTGGDDSSLRRTVELRLASAMMLQSKPIIGVCHGCFLLTEVLGGEVKEIEGHAGVVHAVHYFGDSYTVNSYHSLYIARLHDSGTQLVTDADGNCEAWIDKNIAGVVWHPERMDVPWIPEEIEFLMRIK